MPTSSSSTKGRSGRASSGCTLPKGRTAGRSWPCCSRTTPNETRPPACSRGPLIRECRAQLLANRHLLQQAVAHDFAILCPVAALRLHLLDGLLLPGLERVEALVALGGGDDALRDRNEVKIRLVQKSVDIREDLVVLDPALGLRELEVVLPFACQELC